jgi:hypothetical protein
MSSSTLTKDSAKNLDNKLQLNSNLDKTELDSKKKAGFMKSFIGEAKVTKLSLPILSSRQVMPSFLLCCSFFKTLLLHANF